MVFGVLGGLTPEKRLPQILDAIRGILPYVPTAHLLLAGAPARHYESHADVRNGAWKPSAPSPATSNPITS